MLTAQNQFRLFSLIVLITDFVCFQVSLLVGYYLWVAYPWHGNFQPFELFLVILWILPPVGVIIFKTIGLYKPEMGVIGVQEQSLIFKGIWIVYFIAFAISFFYRDILFSRLATFYSLFIALFLISFERYLFRCFFQWIHKNGISIQKGIIYGAGYQGQRLERWIRQSPKLGIQVVGFLDDQIENIIKVPLVPPFLGKLEELKKLAKTMGVRLFFIAHPKLPEEEIIHIFQICRELKITCWAVPSLYRFYVEKVRILNIGGIPLVGFNEDFVRRSYETIKWIIDKVAALFLLVISLPFSLPIAAMIFFSKDGEVFFKQKRIGYRGIPFEIYKFRTLKATHRETVSPELEKGVTSKISPFRSFLRRSGLDEIPQLINVLKGDMSIIGPRPEMPFLVSRYGVLEKERLNVRPGITGLWQISEDRKRLLIHENMDYDLYYIQNMSFNLDLAILVKTVFVILKRCFKR